MTDEQSEQIEREETIRDLDVPEGQAGAVMGGLKADSNEVAVEGLKAKPKGLAEIGSR